MIVRIPLSNVIILHEIAEKSISRSGQVRSRVTAWKKQILRMVAGNEA